MLVVLGRPARAFVGVTILFVLAGSHGQTCAKKDGEGYCSFFHCCVIRLLECVVMDSRTAGLQKSCKNKPSGIGGKPERRFFLNKQENFTFADLRLERVTVSYFPSFILIASYEHERYNNDGRPSD